MISTKKPPRPCFSTSRGLCKVGKLQIPVQKLIIKSHRGDRMIFARNTSVLRDSGSLFSARLKFEGVWTQFESKVKFWLGFINKFGARDLQSESEIRGEKDIVMARLAIFRIENSKKNIRMPWRRGSIYGVQYSKIVLAFLVCKNPFTTTNFELFHQFTLKFRSGVLKSSGLHLSFKNVSAAYGTRNYPLLCKHCEAVSKSQVQLSTFHQTNLIS